MVSRKKLLNKKGSALNELILLQKENGLKGGSTAVMDSLVLPWSLLQERKC